MSSSINIYKAKEGLCGNKDVGVILKEMGKTLSVKSQILEEYII